MASLELEELLAAFFDRTLDEAGAARLEAILEADPAAADRFRKLLAVEGLLSAEARDPAGWEATQARIMRSVRAHEEVPKPDLVSRVIDSLPGPRPSHRSSSRRPGRPGSSSWTAALMAAGALIGLGVLVYSLSGEKNGKLDESASAEARRKMEDRRRAEERLREIEREREKIVRPESPAAPEPGTEEKRKKELERLDSEKERIERQMREEVEKARKGRETVVQPPEPPAPPPRVEPTPAPPKTVTRVVVAKVEPAGGEVHVLDEGKKVLLKASHELLSGQGLETSGAAGLAWVTFPDKTRLEVASDTLVREIRVEGGKRVSVERGSLRAEITRQPKDQAMVFESVHGKAKVLGTTLRILVDPDPKKGLRLEVEEGKVQLERAADGKTVEVVSGHFAVAAAGLDFAVKRMPVTVVFGGAAGQAEDTFIYGFRGYEHTNSGAMEKLRLSDGPQGFTVLLRFPNLVGTRPGQIPPRAVINAATLKLYCPNVDIILPFRFYRCLKPWGEGKGSLTGAQRGEATWKSAQHPSVPWEAPGAAGRTDRTPDLGVPAAKVDKSGFVTFEITPAVQAWAQGELNYGLILMGRGGGEYSISSSKDKTAANRPLLTVTYTH